MEVAGISFCYNIEMNERILFRKSKENTAPKLVLFCGLPGSGKTTLARKLAEEMPAIRLNTDEWVADFGFDPTYEDIHIKVQKRLWELAKELLQLGQDVVLENGLWTKAERGDKRREAKELDVQTEMHYLNVPLEELQRRLSERNAAGNHGVAVVTPEEVEKFAQIFESPDEGELALYSKSIVH